MNENGDHLSLEYYEADTELCNSFYRLLKNDKPVLEFNIPTKGGMIAEYADIDEDEQKELIIFHPWWGSTYCAQTFLVYKEQTMANGYCWIVPKRSLLKCNWMKPEKCYPFL